MVVKLCEICGVAEAGPRNVEVCNKHFPWWLIIRLAISDATPHRSRNWGSMRSRSAIVDALHGIGYMDCQY